MNHAGENRLKAAGAAGIPQVVSVGGLNNLIYGDKNTVPKELSDEVEAGKRQQFVKSAEENRFNTTPEEVKAMGAEIAGRLYESKGPVALLIPEKGWGSDDCAHKESPFWAGDPADPEKSLRAKEFISGVTDALSGKAKKENLMVLALSKHMNEKEVADLASELLCGMLKGNWDKKSWKAPDFASILF